MKALIFENRVQAVKEKEFEVSPSMTWMDCPDNCEIGWELVVGKDGNGNGMPSGIYFYRLRAGSTTKTKKMVLNR